jgi:hypothetical protein
MMLAIALIVPLLAGSPSGQRIMTAGTKPTCTEALRGVIWFVHGGTGEADTLERCMKGATDTYSWVSGLNTGGGGGPITLGTDTIGNYADGTAEGGAALTGDSATAFFGSGEIEVSRGGTGSAPSADDQVLVSSSINAAAWKSVPDCDSSTAKVLYDTATNTFSCGTDQTSASGPPPLLVYINSAAGAALTWTNMTAAAGFLGASHRHVHRVDLTNYTEVRLRVNKQATAGATASKAILSYKAVPFSVTVGDYANIGTSEVSVAVNVQNTYLETAWINLVTGAKADVFVAVTGTGGDGVLDPTFGTITAEFK